MEPYTRAQDIAAGILARQEVREKLNGVRKADILVGIPSYNNARTIGHVLLAVQAGFARYFPDRKAVIVNCDGGSTDGTTDIIRKCVLKDFQPVLLHYQPPQVLPLAAPHHALDGKGSALRSIFEVADRLKVEACAVVSPDIRSITPEWIELLFKPVTEGGFDYVTPLYRRHKFDSAITNNIIYPLMRALYGKRVRQPIGGHFGFSGRLVQFCLSRGAWDTAVTRHGFGVWMMTEAIANKYRIAQSCLGDKIHNPVEHGADLSDMLYHVVGSAFGLMESGYSVWNSIRGSEPVQIFGSDHKSGREQVKVEVSRMLASFSQGIRNLKDIWIKIIGAGDFSLLEELAAGPEEEFRIPAGLWCRIVYDYALAYHEKKLSDVHLLKSLTPLYLGKTASYFLEVRGKGQQETEAELEKLCIAFEDSKDYLINNWMN